MVNDLMLSILTQINQVPNTYLWIGDLLTIIIWLIYWVSLCTYVITLRAFNCILEQIKYFFIFQSSYCHMAPHMCHSGRVRTTHPKPVEYFHPGYYYKENFILHVLFLGIICFLTNYNHSIFIQVIISKKSGGATFVRTTT